MTASSIRMLKPRKLLTLTATCGTGYHRTGECCVSKQGSGMGDPALGHSEAVCVLQKWDLGHMKAFSLRIFSFGCFESLFFVALFRLVFDLLFSLWASFIFILLYQKRLDFIPIPALLAFWSLISF